MCDGVCVFPFKVGEFTRTMFCPFDKLFLITGISHISSPTVLLANFKMDPHLYICFSQFILPSKTAETSLIMDNTDEGKI